jgi:hypothetical protein
MQNLLSGKVMKFQYSAAHSTFAKDLITRFWQNAKCVRNLSGVDKKTFAEDATS